MESFSGDAEEGTEDLAGNKKFKIRSLKTRLFRKSKKSGEEKAEKLSQSASDITFAERLGSNEDLLSSQRIMGSRAFSHDSIFLSEEGLSDPEPARILSQENVPGKIKALQMKLQLQKMHFGPPPMVLPVRSPDSEDKCGHSEDLFFQSSHETLGETVSSQGTLNKTQLVYPPLCPISKPPPTKTLSPTFSNPWSYSAAQNSPTSTIEPLLDFGTPPRALSRLDSSAARHRMSVKPRNQRASTKKKISSVSQSVSFPQNNKEESEKEHEQKSDVKEEMTEKSEEEVPQQLQLKSVETPPITSDPPLKVSDPNLPQHDHAPPEDELPRVLQVNPDMDAVEAVSNAPSSFLESELKNKRETDLGKQVIFHEKTKTGMAEVLSDQISSNLSSPVPTKSGCAPCEGQSFRGITRPSPGSGSFHFSSVKSGDDDRPRSSSFVLKQAEALLKREEKIVRDKEDLKGFQLKGSPSALGRFKQEGASIKVSGAPWEKKDSAKTEEPASPTKTVLVETVAAETEEADDSPGQLEEAEEATEAREEEKKTAFGIKLRATSQSIKFRSEAATNRLSKTVMQEELSKKPKKMEVGEKSSGMSEKMHTSTSSTLRPTDPAPAGVSFQIKHNIPPTDNLNSPNTVQTSSSSVKETEPQPAPQTSSTEVSWMSLAMEKTRTIQQLFTSRLSRDSGARTQPQSTVQTEATSGMQTQKETTSGQQNPIVPSATNLTIADKKAVGEPSSSTFLRDVQSTARPQGQSVDHTETRIVPQSQNETVTCQQHPTQTPNQPLSDTAWEESVQTLETSLKPSIVVKRQKMTSPALSHISRESYSFKQTKEDQSQLNPSLHTSQSVSPSALQTNPWMSLSPLRSASQTVSSSHSGQVNAPEPLAQASVQHQLAPWSNPPAGQLKSTTAAQTPTPAGPPADSASESGEKEPPTQKDVPSLSVRRAVWTGSASDRAVFLEKRAAWTTTPVIKGVELRKPQTEVQTASEPPSPAKVTPPSKDTTADGKQWVKPAPGETDF
uniref:DUF4592 domain-containing protein n=1 Tax=Oryzias sinensis TaxID=183150 RepID=A0A8C7YXJ4_9TELE